MPAASIWHACRHPLWIGALATFAVTLSRLVGELQQWSPTLFARSAGGGGGLVGIGWLMPVLGCWCGLALAAHGHLPRRRARAWGWQGVGLLGGVATLAIGRFVLPVWVGTFLFVLAAMSCCAAAAFRAWPALARVLLAYALLARLPTVVVTLVAVANDWGTHYEQLAPGAPPMGDAARATVLCAAQLGIWVPLTLLVGGLCGVAAAWRRR